MVPFATAYAVALVLANITLGVCVFFCRPCQRHDYDDCYGVTDYDDYCGANDYDGEYGDCGGYDCYGPNDYHGYGIDYDEYDYYLDDTYDSYGDTTARRITTWTWKCNAKRKRIDERPSGSEALPLMMTQQGRNGL
ncbi:hypothetical protein LV161_008851 [Aspergillus fumigatus]|nr:hypothetical protein LV161_008851 [Aspergillus fumigatus]